MLRAHVWSVALSDGGGAVCFLSGVDKWVGVERHKEGLDVSLTGCGNSDEEILL